MRKKSTVHVRVDPNTKDVLDQYSRELACIENKSLPLGEIIKRMAKGDDMLPRLKRGSIERKRTI